MADQFKARTLKRKNVKGLALNATPKAASNPSEGDAQIPGAIGNTDSNRTDTLEIGLEFRLDLRSEDLVTLKELGAGNGGTVSKVMHASTKVIMARKVICAPVREMASAGTECTVPSDHPSRCQRECAETDPTRTSGRTRLQFTQYCDILRCFPERSKRYCTVHGIHGLRVGRWQHNCARGVVS